MKIVSLTRVALKPMLLTLLMLPTLAGAQYFTDTQEGDVNAGFRKTGQFQEQYEMVVYLGNVTDFLAMAPGAQVRINNFAGQLSTMCPDGFGNLQWSVFASFQGTISNSSGAWPRSCCWYTVPRTNETAQTQPINRQPVVLANHLSSLILGVSVGANTSSSQLGQTNANNNSLLVLEPVNFNPANNLTTYIGDPADHALGDFSGYLNFSVENTTPGVFSSPAVSDFYVNVPSGTVFGKPIVDPLTGSTSGVADYLGYFTLDPDGTMTFTRAGGAIAAPVAAFTGAPVSGFAPLQVAFSDASTGDITNWTWNFGDGRSATNTTSGDVNHTYAAAGSYTVTLTVIGPGGTDTKTEAAYVTALAVPRIGITVSTGGNLVFSGTNVPAGVQYRILTSTNVAAPLANWAPIATNTFPSNGGFSYTNLISGKGNAFFRLVSP